MNQERPVRADGPQPARERHAPPAGDIFYLQVPQKRHKGEVILLLATLALLFVLLAVPVGHPKPPPHPQIHVPAHTSAVR